MKKVGAGIAVVVFAFTLISSWMSFFTEQKLNTTEIRNLKEDNRELTGVVNTLNLTQTRIIETVSNQSSDTKELQKDFKKTLEILGKNQVMIAKLVARSELE